MSRVSDLTVWFCSLVASVPTLATLLIGLRICWTNRYRRPRVSRILGAVLILELGWRLGIERLVVAIQSLLIPWPRIVDSRHALFWWTLWLASLPSSCVAAAIWGTAMWTVLRIDDFSSRSRGEVKDPSCDL